MTITTHKARRFAPLAAALALPALLLALAACAPAAGSAPQSTPDSSQQKLSYSEWQLKYAECMRGQGVDVDDPKDGAISMALGDQEATAAANKVCTAELGEPPTAPAGTNEGGDDYMAWATKVTQCYRDNGYDMPDPVEGEILQFPADTPMDVQTECGAGQGTVVGRTQ